MQITINIYVLPTLKVFPFKFNVASINSSPEISISLLSVYPSIILILPAYVSITLAEPVRPTYPVTAQFVPFNSPVTAAVAFLMLSHCRLQMSNLQNEIHHYVMNQSLLHDSFHL